MERTAWTDERLDDFARHVDSRFDRLDSDLREFRQEVRTEITGLRSEVGDEISGLRGELRSEIGGVRGDIETLRVIMIRALTIGAGAIMTGLLGVIAAVLAGG
jgi:hypothetical protein